MTVRIEIDGPDGESVRNEMRKLLGVRDIALHWKEVALTDESPQAPADPESVAAVDGVARSTATESASHVENVTLTNTSRAGESEQQTAARRKRRTKAEIAADEAAKTAKPGRGVEIISQTGVEAVEQPLISTGEERVDPSDIRYFVHPESGGHLTTTDGSRPESDGLLEEVDKAEYEKFIAAQDAADEQAESEATRPAELTRDDVRHVSGEYVARYGMPAAIEDGAKLFDILSKKLGVTLDRISNLPEDQTVLRAIIDGFREMAEKNPYKRATVNG